MDRFYVYVLYRSDGETPFYVGKGRGARWLDHERRAARAGVRRYFKGMPWIAVNE